MAVIDTVDDTGKKVKVIKTVDDTGASSQATFYSNNGKYQQLLPNGMFKDVNDAGVLSQLSGGSALGSTAKTNELLGGNYFDTTTGSQVKPFVPAPVSNPVQAPNQSNVGAVPPALPQPTAPTIGENYITSVTKDLENNKQGLQGAYQEQQNLLQKKIDEQNVKISELETLKQEGVLKNIEKQSAPFRAELEKSEREKLYVNENFEANQKLTNELDSLLTQGNQLIEQSKKNPVPTAIGVALTNKTISDVSARAGVIQAVMSARNNQISQAYTLIDRSVAAMNADRQDQLDYYKTLFNYYDKQKDEAGDKVVSLDKEKRKYLDAQIGILEGELKQSQANAENLKQAMTDPDTALAYAQAGVTLNDSPEQINKKLADYGYAKEVAELSNDMAQRGYTALISGSAPAGSEVVTTTDSKGRTKMYYKKGTANNNDPDAKNLTDKQKAQMVSVADSALRSSIDPKTGMIDGPKYLSVRNDWGAYQSTIDFDKAFGHLLSEADHAKYGIPSY